MCSASRAWQIAKTKRAADCSLCAFAINDDGADSLVHCIPSPSLPLQNFWIRQCSPTELVPQVCKLLMLKLGPLILALQYLLAVTLFSTGLAQAPPIRPSV